MKKLMITIGYRNYVIKETDAIRLLTIASRLQEVENHGYGNPYTYKEVSEPFLSDVQLIEILESELTVDNPIPSPIISAEEIPF